MSKALSDMGLLVRCFGLVSDILPRENVFTYHAWRALGRQVRRGEHGVKVTTWIPTERKELDEKTGYERVTTGRI